MKVTNILDDIPKKVPKNTINRKYGISGLSLGDELYTRLDNYCEINNIHKSKLIKALLIKYLDEVEKED